jgi:hypothetical protein
MRERKLRSILNWYGAKTRTTSITPVQRLVSAKRKNFFKPLKGKFVTAFHGDTQIAKLAISKA